MALKNPRIEMWIKHYDSSMLDSPDIDMEVVQSGSSKRFFDENMTYYILLES